MQYKNVRVVEIKSSRIRTNCGMVKFHDFFDFLGKISLDVFFLGGGSVWNFCFLGEWGRVKQMY